MTEESNHCDQVQENTPDNQWKKGLFPTVEEIGPGHTAEVGVEPRCKWLIGFIGILEERSRTNKAAESGDWNIRGVR